MSQYLTVWGDNSNNQLNIPNKFGPIVGLNSNLISGNQNTQYFSLGARHGLVSSSGTQIYNKPLTDQNYIVTGYKLIRVPVITPWGDNTFFQLDIQRSSFFYEKYDAGFDTTYIIDLHLGLIHGYGYDLIFSDVTNATGEIVNWTQADFFNNGVLPQSLLRYPRGFLDVKAGDGYVLALDRNNKITGWGNSGNPVISGKQYTGINNLGNIKQIAAGKNHALVLFDNGLITGWGDNSYGQLDIDTGIFNSGIKISTKVDYNLALGFQSPLIANITGGSNAIFNIKNIGRFNKSAQVTGLNIQYSLDRNIWIDNLFITGLAYKEFTSFTGNNLPTGNNNYYVRLIESYNASGIQNTGSTSIYNPTTNKFDLWTDYRIFGWGTGNDGLASIPDAIKNERIIDIAAGYENNIVLTEKPISLEEMRAAPLQGQFISSPVIVSGAGFEILNKIYTLDSVLNDRPFYRYFSGITVPPTSTNLTIFWDNTQWGIYSGFNLIYYNPDNVLYPWSSQNWLIASDYTGNYLFTPAPTGVIEFIETDPIIPPCSGFIFDTGADVIFELRLQSFDITTNSFKVKWNKVINADNYRLDIATNSNFSNFVTGYQNKLLSTGQNNDIITGLNAFTTYYGQIKAINDEEIFVASQILKQETRLSAPTGLSTNNISSTGFRLNWGAVSGAENYRIDVSKDPLFLTTFETNYKNRVVNNTGELISGLNQLTAYHSRVRAVNSFGSSVNSEVLTQSTI